MLNEKSQFPYRMGRKKLLSVNNIFHCWFSRFSDIKIVIVIAQRRSQKARSKCNNEKKILLSFYYKVVTSFHIWKYDIDYEEFTFIEQPLDATITDYYPIAFHIRIGQLKSGKSSTQQALYW